MVDIQRRRSSVQLNRPWLQSRWPSSPTSRFKAFLFPPAAPIGVVACYFTQMEKIDQQSAKKGTTWMRTRGWEVIGVLDSVDIVRGVVEWRKNSHDKAFYAS